jgi:Domain of unknown function (DUF1707)
MRPSAPVRASDADRERALRALQDHYAAGRLEYDELEERAARATQAQFKDDLRRLLADLPRDVRRRGTRVAERVDRAALRAHAAAYGATNAALVGTWGLTGGGEFWPAWSILPWGAALAGHAWCSRAFRRSVKRLTSGGRSDPPRRLAR